MKNSKTRISKMIEPTVEALGLQLWGIEHNQQGKNSLLRIYIERDAGITIEDCEQVSRQVSALLDVEDPIAGEYTLEVSSPGVDRPLFTVQQFEQYIGSEVILRLGSPLQGRRNFKGIVNKVDGGNIFLQVEDTEWNLVHTDIEKANVVY